MLTLSNLTKSYAGRTLFRDASLQVNRGERIGLVGPNGAGKSTLFSLILKENSPDEGQVNLNARHDARLPAAGERPGGRRDHPCPGHLPRRTDEYAAHVARAQGQAHPARAGIQGDGFRQTRAHVQRRLGHAGAPRALADAGAGPADARRADQPPRPRSVAVVPGIPERLSGRDPDDLARPGVPQSTHRSTAEISHGQLHLYRGNYDSYLDPARRPPRAADSTPTRRSSARSRVCSGSPTVSARKRASPARRRASSSRSRAWTSSKHPRPRRRR